MNADAAKKRAKKYLRTASRAFEDRDYESCVSRAYYAMFFMARALLQQEDVHPRTHSGMVNQFGLRFVKTGLLPLDTARIFRNAFDLRQLAEYAEDTVISKTEAETTLREAEDFVATLSPLLA